MLGNLLTAAALVAITVAVHCAGLAMLLRLLAKSRPDSVASLWSVTFLFVRIASWMVMLALMEVSIWALFYVWEGCLPDVESAFYFSGVTYSSIGYGDVVLAAPWRLLGPVQGLIGILMSGLSVSVFFAVVSAVYKARCGRQSQ